MALLAARSPRGHARPPAILPGRAHCCSCTVGPPGDLGRALEFGRRHPRSHPCERPGGHSRSPPCTHRPTPGGRCKPRGGDGAHGLPCQPPPHPPPLHAAVPAPFTWKPNLPGRKRAREEFVATPWEVEVETRWPAGAAPQNFLPPCHHVPQPQGRVEGGGDDYCPLHIRVAWRALENGLLRAR